MCIYVLLSSHEPLNPETSPILNGRSGLAVRFQFRGRRAPDSKHRFSRRSDVYDDVKIRSGQMSSRLCGVEAWRGCQLRCHPCHLTTVQNDKVRPNNTHISSELDANVTKLNFRHF
ncbi:hypothetical protein AVEN_200704-1 [Araneus ventricosus]|uniref:Uncharacterized protein n=1 Tax=Araneus ventricosus TaxID=182803 RepID=A0A4Y2IMZ9_ARAVE|nr:hypothetical protein AVEN_200704-1 [Araneus ventricosus]